MAILSRKQREIAERHSHFLAIAREMLHEEGFHQLSMDRVAELAEYSKGTVYQHFNCKEEMLAQLCVSAMQRLLALGQRAVNHKGPHRERLLAFFLAHDVFQQLQYDDVCMMQNYHTDQVLDKVSASTRERHDQLEAGIFNLVKSIVDDAMNDGELPQGTLTSSEIVFGLWSLTHGAETLRSYNLPLAEMGVSNPSWALILLLQSMLDGMGWKPISDKEHTAESIDHLRKTLFQDEIDAAQKHAETS